MSDDRLFGAPGADVLYSDLASAYEAWRDDGLGELEDGWVVVFEEWTVRLPEHDVAGMETRVAGWVVELVDESDYSGDYEYAEAWDRAAQDPAVLTALRAALALMASKVTGWKQAGALVAVHAVTHLAGEPFVDGQPLYVAEA